MDQTTPNESLNPREQTAPGSERAAGQASGSSERKWVTMPDQWPQWLTKRIEFALPVWVCATVVLMLALLIFD